MSSVRERGEYALPDDHPSGTCQPMWLDLDTTVRPRELFAAIRKHGVDALEARPLRLTESTGR